MNFSRLKIPTITLAAVALVVGVSSTAVAAKLITSADIKDGTIVSKDLKKGAIGGDRLKNGSINTGRLKDGAVTSSKIKDGAVGPNDLSQAAEAWAEAAEKAADRVSSALPKIQLQKRSFFS